MAAYLQMHDYYTGNLAALIMICALYLGRVVVLRETRSEEKMVNRLLRQVVFYCTLEMLSSALSGPSCKGVYIFQVLANSMLFISNMMIELTAIRLMAAHLGYRIGDGEDFILKGLFWLGVSILLLNLFRPVIFRIDPEDASYHPGDFYFIFQAIGILFYSECVHFYLVSRKKGGSLKFFPIGALLVPSFLGMLLDSITGSSYIGACNCIAVVVTVSSMRDERIYRDALTGLYNRSYLEEVRKRLERMKKPYISGIMLDLNGFKSINDRFGHAEGDEALIQAAGIIRAAAGTGEAIRYAGDEFIVLLNTWEEDGIRDCMRRITEGFAAYNRESGKPYELSASMGCSNYNAETQTINEFLNRIDRNMYESKRQYHAKEENPGNG